jgi:K+-transporting ATPase ATPase C chain
VTLLLTGLLYPLLVTALSQLLFSERANGSLVRNERGQVVGSELIGQVFTDPAYFQSRPSAAGNGYDPTASNGSNLGPTSQKLKDRVTQDIARLRKESPGAIGQVPGDLVTASGSGLDPHLSPEAALWQVSRIARARNVASERIRSIVDANIEGRDLGFLGEPRVNVLGLNLALDMKFGRPTGARAAKQDG